MRDTEEGCKWTNRRGLLPPQCDSETRAPAVTCAVDGHSKSYTPADVFMGYVTWLTCYTVLHEIGRFYVRLCACLISLVYIPVRLWSIVFSCCHIQLWSVAIQMMVFFWVVLNRMVSFVGLDVSEKPNSTFFRSAESTWTNLVIWWGIKTGNNVTIWRTPVITRKFKVLCFFWVSFCVCLIWRVYILHLVVKYSHLLVIHKTVKCYTSRT